MSEDTSRPRILILEDVEAIAMAASTHLRAGGFETHVAPNGAAGLAMASTVRPDLVLSDIMMPIVDGMEFLRRAKEVEELRGVPILMLSAVADRDRVMQCLLLGAVDFVPKPFDPALLLKKIRKHVRPRGAETDPAAKTAPPVESAPTGEKPLALVAAASKDVVEALRAPLSERYGVQVVADGAAALDAVARLAPPAIVVIVEAKLPVFDGVEVLTKLRAMKSTAGARLALVAGRHDHDAIRKAQALGDVEVLGKPLEPAAVVAFLEKLAGATSEPGAASPGAKTAAFDPAPLEALRATASTTDAGTPPAVDPALDGILEAFFSDATQRIAALKTALASGDAKAVAEAAHALKGGSASVGAVGLAELSRELEEAARAEQLEAKSAANAERLEASFGSYREAVTAWRKGPGDAASG